MAQSFFVLFFKKEHVFSLPRRASRIVATLLTLLLIVAILRPFEQLIYRFSKVGHTPFPDPGYFPWTATLERHWHEIRAELDCVMRLEDHVPNYIDLSTEARGLTAPDRWKSFFFYAYGEKIPENCARCPRTCALLTTIPGLKSGFFSILRPGAHLAPHRGHFAGILRYHLGLIIPDTQSCGLRVDGQVVHWREGASLIFDDSFIHEAWNESAASRVVLFVDFMRPLPAPLAALSHALVWLVAKSSVVQPGLRRLAIWNRHFATLWNRQAG